MRVCAGPDGSDHVGLTGSRRVGPTSSRLRPKGILGAVIIIALSVFQEHPTGMAYGTPYIESPQETGYSSLRVAMPGMWPTIFIFLRRACKGAPGHLVVLCCPVAWRRKRATENLQPKEGNAAR